MCLVNYVLSSSSLFKISRTRQAKQNCSFTFECTVPLNVVYCHTQLNQAHILHMCTGYLRKTSSQKICRQYQKPSEARPGQARPGKGQTVCARYGEQACPSVHLLINLFGGHFHQGSAEMTIVSATVWSAWPMGVNRRRRLEVQQIYENKLNLWKVQFLHFSVVIHICILLRLNSSRGSSSVA